MGVSYEFLTNALNKIDIVGMKKRWYAHAVGTFVRKP